MDVEKPVVKRQLPNILVTGTPGTGKTTLSRLLSEYLPEMKYVNVGELIKQNKLYDSWNEEFDCPEFNEDMVVDALEYIHETGGHVIDFHSSSFFPERWFDLVVLLRTDNTVLYDRLAARNYSVKKIEENISCEIMEVTADEVKEAYKEEIIMELANNQESEVELNLTKIIEWIKLWVEKRKVEQ